MASVGFTRSANRTPMFCSEASWRPPRRTLEERHSCLFTAYGMAAGAAAQALLARINERHRRIEKLAMGSHGPGSQVGESKVVSCRRISALV